MRERKKGTTYIKGLKDVSLHLHGQAPRMHRPLTFWLA
jgi:hypothetical protein